MSKISINKQYPTDETTNSKRNYQDSSLKNDFFENLSNLKSKDISHFLSDLSKRYGANISAEYLKELQSKINELAISASDKPNLAEIGIILNSLASLKYKKLDLLKLDIINLVQIFNADKNPNVRNMLGLLNGCARLGFDKIELQFDSEKLFTTINLEFATLRTSEKIKLLNSLAKIGYDKKDITLFPAILKTVREAIKEVETLDGKDIEALIHSCAKMEIYDEIFDAQEKLTAALTPEKILELSWQSAFSLLQTQMFCKIDCEKGFFNPEMLKEISEIYSLKSDPISISKLQSSIAGILEKNGYDVSQEHSVYQVNDISTHDVDIFATKTIKGEKKNFYIEVDGPSHYLKSSHIVDSATEKRDHFNKEAIALRDDSITKSFYLTLPYYDFEVYGFEVFRQNPDDFLLTRAVEIESRAYEKILNEGVEYTTEKKSEKYLDEAILKGKEELNKSKKSKKSKKNKKTKTQNFEVKTEIKEEVVATAFETAIKTHNLSLVVEAIRDGKDVNQILTSGETAFDCVLERSLGSLDSPKSLKSITPNLNFLKILNVLIKAGAEVRSSKILSSEDCKIKLSDLLQDAQLNGFESLAWALIKFSSAYLKGDELTNAVKSNSLKVVDALIERNHFNSESQDAKNAINLSAAKVFNGTGEIEILVSLINKGKINSSLELEESLLREYLSEEFSSEEFSLEEYLRELLFISLEDRYPEIFIPLFEDNNLSRDFLFGSKFELQDSLILSLAAFLGNTDIVKFLINFLEKKNEHAADFEKLCKSSIIIAAIDGEHLETIKYLVEEKNIDLKKIYGIGDTPIARAIKTGNCKIISYLIGNGADINLQKIPEEFRNKLPLSLKEGDDTSSINQDPINTAWEAGKLHLIQLLINKGANNYKTYEDGRKITYVNFAVINHDYGLLSNLIDGGLDVTSEQNAENRMITPLELAVVGMQSKPELLENGAVNINLLLMKGSDPNKQLSNKGEKTITKTIFHKAILTPNVPVEIIEKMIVLGKADCVGDKPENLVDGKESPLEFVVKLMKTNRESSQRLGDIIVLLVKNGADPNKQISDNKEGETIFHRAILTPFFPVQIIRDMIEFGKADCVGKTTDCFGKTTETLFKGKITPIELVVNKEEEYRTKFDPIIVKIFIKLTPITLKQPQLDSNKS